MPANDENVGGDEQTGGGSDTTVDRRTYLKLAGAGAALVGGYSLFESSPAGAVSLQQVSATGADGQAIASQLAAQTLSVAESEPNDQRDTATATSTNATVSGSLTTGDLDWYAFEAGAGEPLSIEFTRESDDGVSALSIYGPDGAFLNMVYVGTASPSPLETVTEASGTHYLSVAAIEGGTGSYSLLVKDSSYTTPTTTQEPTTTTAAPTTTEEPTTTTVDDGQAPYGGTAWPVPGRVQAEDYDAGGEDVAYFDTDDVQQGGVYRTDEVDVQDGGDGYNVGYTADAEWLEYTVDVAAGTYDLDLRVASGTTDAGSVTVLLDGTALGTVDVGATGGWTTFETLTLSGVDLPGGTAILRVEFTGGLVNLDYVEFSASSTTTTEEPTTTTTTTEEPTTTTIDDGQDPYSGAAPELPARIEAEDYDTGGPDVAYFDADAGNTGGAYRSDDVDIQATGDVDGAYNVGWIRDNEWLEYTVDTVAGSHEVRARVASPNTGGQLRVLLDGTEIGVLDVPNTGGWQTWTTASFGPVDIDGGTDRTLRLEAVTGEFNLNWIAVVAEDTTDTTTTTTSTTSSGGTTDSRVSGELRTWHAVEVAFDGPSTSETADPNPFMDYRLDVTFTGPSGQTFLVPGHFAADGAAAETSATSGSTWRAYFMPEETGEWTYEASFTEGTAVAVDGGGTATAFDGASGSFTVAETDKTGRDLRGKGTLRYVGEHYLRFAGTGEYFLKSGADSPENFLAYDGFDNTYSVGGDGPATASGVHEYGPHEGDFRSGDPTWQGGKGQGIVGAVNYLAEQGINSQYFLTYNVDGGDGQDTWPWLDPGSKQRYDVSKLDQWDIVFSHMASQGLNLHVVTQEKENDTVIDGGGLGPTRKLYYRELVSRFAHHPAITWNLGEESDLTRSELRNDAAFLDEVDPYVHQVVVHNGPDDSIFADLVGDSDFDGTALQDSADYAVEDRIKKWRRESAAAGRPWAVNFDEFGCWCNGVPCDGETVDGADQDYVRRAALWPGYLSGAAGLEYYFGLETCAADRGCEDFRTRSNWWPIARYAHQFVVEHLPIPDVAPDDALLRNAAGNVLAGGGTYAVYLPDGPGSAEIDLPSGEYTLRWYNPRTGGFEASTTLSGGGWTALGSAPFGEDAVALIE